MSMTGDVISGKFTPPEGKTLLIIGQDTESIDTYVQSVGNIPGGMTKTTSLSELEGIHETAYYGSGPHNLDYLAETYPESAIVVGLSLVNYLPYVRRVTADERIDLLLDAGRTRIV